MEQKNTGKYNTRDFADQYVTKKIIVKWEKKRNPDGKPGELKDGGEIRALQCAD